MFASTGCGLNMPDAWPWLSSATSSHSGHRPLLMCTSRRVLPVTAVSSIPLTATPICTRAVWVPVASAAGSADSSGRSAARTAASVALRMLLIAFR